MLLDNNMGKAYHGYLKIGQQQYAVFIEKCLQLLTEHWALALVLYPQQSEAGL